MSEDTAQKRAPARRSAARKKFEGTDSRGRHVVIYRDSVCYYHHSEKEGGHLSLYTAAGAVYLVGEMITAYFEQE